MIKIRDMQEYTKGGASGFKGGEDPSVYDPGDFSYEGYLEDTGVADKPWLKKAYKPPTPSDIATLNKSLIDIKQSQFDATEKVFKKRKIPFRSFEVLKRNEETLGELFSFFVLETILLGRLMKVNPFDQPSVELIKDETKRQFSQ